MILIGRDPACDVVLQSPGVSGVQALLLPGTDGTHRVVDVDSTNGTFVNGRRVTDATVAPQDELRFGATCLFNWETYGWAVEHPSDSLLVLSIGRDRTCDISVPDTRVSGRHAVVIDKGNAWFLVDLGSANGTSVNGTQVTSARVGPGDVVRFGSLDADLDALVPQGRAVRQAGGRLAAHQAPAAVQSASDGGGPNQRERLIAFLLLGAAGVLLAAMMVTLAVMSGWNSGPLGSLRSAVGLKDSWDAAVEKASAELRARPDLPARLSRDAETASRLATLLEPFDALRPVVSQVDGWKNMRPGGEIGSAITAARELFGADVPDNAYDAVIAALELSSPGSGRTVRALERVVRGALESRDAVAGLDRALRSSGEAVQAFLGNPSRATLTHLAGVSRAASLSIARASASLAPWAESLRQVLGGVDSLRGAISAASATAAGAVVRPQLSTLDSIVLEASAPVRDIAGTVSDIRASLDREREALRAASSVVEGLQ